MESDSLEEEGNTRKSRSRRRVDGWMDRDGVTRF